MLEVTRGGLYEWLAKPESDRDIEDRRLLGLIGNFYTGGDVPFRFSRAGQCPLSEFLAPTASQVAFRSSYRGY
jgi:hypothetical protein